MTGHHAGGADRGEAPAGSASCSGGVGPAGRTRGGGGKFPLPRGRIGPNDGGVREIVVMTGAGISAESGIPTFRDAGGLWEGHRPEDVATPEAFLRDPELVHRFYNARRRALAACPPNPAHHALARLEQMIGDRLLLVTQNVDDLHERAGSRDVCHLHGELLKSRCARCGDARPCPGDLSVDDACPSCGSVGTMRPDVVWFGEIPHHLERITEAVRNCRVFAAIGTSGLVYPAAGFVDLAAAAGARTVEINLASTQASPAFDERLEGPAGTRVVEWVDAVLAGRSTSP